MKRLVAFSFKHSVNISLAYYPPYHSNDNPIERVWGRLEQHWNGELLDSVDKVLGLAKTMTWKGSLYCTDGSSTLPINRMVPVILSRIKKTNGLSTKIFTGSGIAVSSMTTAVAAAASMPSSSTAIKAGTFPFSRSPVRGVRLSLLSLS